MKKYRGLIIYIICIVVLALVFHDYWQAIVVIGLMSLMGYYRTRDFSDQTKYERKDSE